MNKQNLENIVRYIVKQGIKAITDNTDENDLIVDYVAIFSKNNTEFKNLDLLAKSLGVEVNKKTRQTGHTYLLNQRIKTIAGPVKLVKIRKPDLTRSQRGGPDFKTHGYPEFKRKYLKSSGNFTLMTRKNYEMIELKGVDVLVYFPNKPLGEELGIYSD